MERGGLPIVSNPDIPSASSSRGDRQRLTDGARKLPVQPTKRFGWNDCPEEIFLMICAYLPDESRIPLAHTCSAWKRIILGNAMNGRVHFRTDTEMAAQPASYHEFAVRYFSEKARSLFFFDLDFTRTLKLLNDLAVRCDPDRLETLILMGDAIMGAFRVTSKSYDYDYDGQADGVGERLVIPSLCQFLKGKPYDYGEMMADVTPKRHPQSSSYRSVRKRRKNDGGDGGEQPYSLRHFGLINTRLTASATSLFDPLWSALVRHAGKTLERLDLIHLTDHMYMPSNLLSRFDALRQIAISPNHFSAIPLADFAKLKSLDHLLLYVGFHVNERERSGVSIDKSSLEKFRVVKPEVEFSFVVKTIRDVKDFVPDDVPIRGLEIVIVDSLSNVVEDFANDDDHPQRSSTLLNATKKRIVPKLRRVKHLALINRGESARGADYLHLFEMLSMESSDAAKERPNKQPKRRSYPLPELESFQLGGDFPADFYVKMARLVRGFSPKLRNWVVYLDENTFVHGPHSVMSHMKSNPDAKGSKTQGKNTCEAPADDRIPMRCSASDRSCLHRKLTGILRTAEGRDAESLLRVMTKREFYGYSSFWNEQDRQVMRQLRRPDC